MFSFPALIRKVFPGFRSRSELLREITSLRAFCGVTEGPPEMWDISLAIRDLEFERNRLQSTLASLEAEAQHARRNFHRVLKRWQCNNNDFTYHHPHELCEILLDKLEWFRVLPLIHSLRRDHRNRWWATITINTDICGQDLDECLREAYNHLGLERRNRGTKTFHK